MANFSYTFDTLGDLTSRADIIQDLSETFQYDAQNRIIVRFVRRPQPILVMAR